MLRETTILLLPAADAPLRRDDPGLSEAGQMRAEAWAQALAAEAPFGLARRPDELFSTAAAPYDARPSLTLRPLAETLGLEVRDEFVPGEHALLVRHLRRDHALDGKTIVVCWTASALLRLAQELGVEHELLPPSALWPLRWERDDLGRLLVLSFDESGRIDIDSTRCLENVTDALEA